MTSDLHDRTGLLARAEEARLCANGTLDAERRVELGQFMTPSPIAALMAGMFDLGRREVRVLDAGAGVGSLTAAFVSELCHRRTRPRSISATAFEVEPAMLGHLKEVLRSCGRVAQNANVRFAGEIEQRDFISAAATMLDGGLFKAQDAPRFDAAILNPPYRKIHSLSKERRILRDLGIETTNLYAAFVALAVRLLAPDGELVAITPRSFCNGPYFRPFRHLLLTEMTLLRVHSFETRDRAFSDDDVLQENVIFHARKGTRRGRVLLSTSSTPDEKPRKRSVPHDTVVDPADRDAFIHLAVSSADARVAAAMRALPCTLANLGLEVSTGRVVDFRSREHLRQEPTAGTVPLIYPAHFRDGYVAWPRADGRKPNALADVNATADLLVPNGTYVLTKRFTSKEERRRVVAAIYDPTRLPRTVAQVGFENHINYLHVGGKGMPKSLARGLASFLNSSLVDAYFRQFNGHTQVNATDLRNLRYPSRNVLVGLGSRARVRFQDQSELDRIVGIALGFAAKSAAR